MQNDMGILSIEYIFSSIFKKKLAKSGLSWAKSGFKMKIESDKNDKDLFPIPGIDSASSGLRLINESKVNILTALKAEPTRKPIRASRRTRERINSRLSIFFL